MTDRITSARIPIVMPAMTPEESPVKLGCIAPAVLESIVALEEALEEVLESETADEVVLADASVGSVMLK